MSFVVSLGGAVACCSSVGTVVAVDAVEPVVVVERLLFCVFVVLDEMFDSVSVTQRIASS